MELVSCDVSYFQRPVDDTYPHRWLIFRCSDGSFFDPNAAHNNAWSVAAVKAGRMLGWTTYVVYRPGMNATTIANLKRLDLAGGHIMVDVESWSGQITGDHSADIDALIAACQQLAPGRVWEYGNRGDLRALDSNGQNVPVVIASYGGSKPVEPNLAAWQYTDGTWTVPGLPSSSPPFGNCDHNVIYLNETTSSNTAEEVDADMPLNDTDKKYIADLVNAAAQAAGDRAARLTAETLATIRSGLVSEIRGARSATVAAATDDSVDEIVAAVVAKLPKPTTANGGVTVAQVGAAVKQALREGTG